MNLIESYSKQYAIQKDNKNKKRVTAASVGGSLLGIVAAVGGVYSLAKKNNPSVNLKNIVYGEKDTIIICGASIVGGLTGGLIADKNKENRTLKYREALQQFFGSNLCPVALLALNNKILEKSEFKLPKINSSSKLAKTINPILSVLPQIVVTIGSLVGGMNIGNSIVNKINDKLFNSNEKHYVKPEDYLVHSDDLCMAVNLLFRKINIKVSSVASKFLPLTFLLSGTKAGMQRKENV